MKGREGKKIYFSEGFTVLKISTNRGTLSQVELLGLLLLETQEYPGAHSWRLLQAMPAVLLVSSHTPVIMTKCKKRKTKRGEERNRERRAEERGERMKWRGERGKVKIII